MNDPEKLLSSMKFVDAPTELRRKILNSLEAPASISFWRLLMEDWNGWTVRAWFSSFVILTGLFLISHLENPSSSTGGNVQIDGKNLRAVFEAQQKLLAELKISLWEDPPPLPSETKKEKPRSELPYHHAMDV